MPLLTAGSRQPSNKYAVDELSKSKDREFVESMTSRLDRLSKTVTTNSGPARVNKHATYRRTKSDCRPTKSDCRPTVSFGEDVLVHYGRSTKPNYSGLKQETTLTHPTGSSTPLPNLSSVHWNDRQFKHHRIDDHRIRGVINSYLQKSDPDKARSEVTHHILKKIRENPETAAIRYTRGGSVGGGSVRAELDSFAHKIGKCSLPADRDGNIDHTDNIWTRLALNRGELARLEKLVSYTFDHRLDHFYGQETNDHLQDLIGGQNKEPQLDFFPMAEHAVNWARARINEVNNLHQ